MLVVTLVYTAIANPDTQQVNLLKSKASDVDNNQSNNYQGGGGQNQGSGYGQKLKNERLVY